MKTLKLRQSLAAKWWSKDASPVVIPDSKLLTTTGKGPGAERWSQGLQPANFVSERCVPPPPHPITTKYFTLGSEIFTVEALNNENWG